MSLHELKAQQISINTYKEIFMRQIWELKLSNSAIKEGYSK